MQRKYRWRWLGPASLGLFLGALSGCQTWISEVGLTLPTGSYLRHPPQYIPPSPPFPLERELAAQEEAAAVGAEGGGPPPPPPGGGGEPPPQPGP
jgi:hypothetical protein